MLYTTLLCFLSLLPLALSQCGSAGDDNTCSKRGYECDLNQGEFGQCVAVSCDALGACRPEEGCIEQVCITSPCPVKCSPCPVVDCPRPPDSIEGCRIIDPSPYTDETTGCYFEGCTTYDCPNVDRCALVECRPGWQCDSTDGRCVAVSCDAEGACEDYQYCQQVECIRAPCEVVCQPCPVVTCLPPPDNYDETTCRTVRPDPYVDENGCTIEGCPRYECRPEPCPQIRCQEECAFGRKTDDNGCETCECVACPPVCAIWCEHGNVMRDGCPTCACNPPPTLSCSSNDDCDECHRCDAGGCLFTERSFQRDCNTCQCSRDDLGNVFISCTEMACEPDKPICREGATKLSEDGCNSCHCRCDDSGTCGWACTKMYCPTEPPARCPDVLCRMYCENGYVKDKNGCDTCECVQREDFCSTVRCEDPNCGRGQKEVQGKCCLTCEDVELAGEDNCDVFKLAKAAVEDDETNTYIALRVPTECHRDTIQDQIDRILRAVLLDAAADVQAYVKASCCMDSRLNLIILLQSTSEDDSKKEETKAVDNLEKALQNPSSALRSEYNPEGLNVVDSAFLSGQQSETPTAEGLSSKDKILIAVGVLVGSLILLGAVSYFRQPAKGHEELSEEGGEQAMEEGTVEGIAMTETGTAAGSTEQPRADEFRSA